MKNLLLAFAVASTTVCFSQKAPLKFGDIPMEALTMTSYAADSSAEAVVLMDYGFSTIEYSQSFGFELFFERIRRIKVLTEGGKQWADFTISLYHEDDRTEKLTQFKGVTVNLENGKAVESKLSDNGIFKEKYSRNIDQVKVTMPNVRVGSVLDISYKVKSDFLVNFQDWEFQSMIPVVWSEYRVDIPEYFVYHKHIQGYLPITVNEATSATGSVVLKSQQRSESGALGGGGFKTGSSESERLEYILQKFRWVMKDVPAFEEEPYLTTRNDYISRIDFELATVVMPDEKPRQILGSWEEINKRFCESPDFLSEVTGNGLLLRKIAEDLTAGATTVPQKIEAIMAYVKEKVAWNGRSHYLPEKSLKQALDEKQGNSAEINLLLASMLEKVDVNVKPVLLSTRDHGFIREATPTASQFNYVVTMVRWENTQLLLDGTSGYLPIGLLPSRCLNGQGMAVSKEGPEWVKLNPAAKTRTIINSTLALSLDGVLNGQIKLEHYGYEAAEQREEYVSKGDAEYVKSLAGTRQWELTGSEFANVKELNEGFKEKHDVVINEHVSMAGDVMYMNPFFEGQWTNNPFKSEKREYPVDFGNAFDEVYSVEVKIPEGLTAEELPPQKMIMMPGNAARYTFTSAINSGVILITSRLTVSKSLFTTDEYGDLREFFNQVVAKQAEQIVIRKK